MFESIAPTWLWVVFIAIVIAALIIDFIVLNKQGSHEVGIKEAINWSIVWVALTRGTARDRRSTRRGWSTGSRPPESP